MGVGTRNLTVSCLQPVISAGSSPLVVMRGPDGVEYPNRGVYLEVIENERGHARQAGGDSTLKLRRHGYGGLGAKSSAAVHWRERDRRPGRIVLRPQYRYQALRLKAHRCAAAGLDSGTAAERLASMPSTP